MKSGCVLMGAALAVVAAIAAAAAKEPEPPPGSPAACHKTALALIGMIDGGETATPQYRSAFAAFVGTCGRRLVIPLPVPGRLKRLPCRDHLVALANLIDNGQIRSGAFGRGRNAFAKVCQPR